MIIDGLQINDWTREVIAEVRSGGVNVVHATVGVWEDMASAMTRIGAFRHLCRHNADLIRIVRSVEGIHEAVDDDVLAVVLGFQNSSMLGDDPEMAGIFADVGIRVIQLTYNIANHLGSSCWEPQDGGLTRAGYRMVAALNDAGVLVDISHVGNSTGRDAVEASVAPVAITHGNP
ncbi:MAG TPA: peptidase M19, partial [Acidimicrobiaceae bacterium]|nr:peptidase M19 [Acidimicrobiaceae bacterium]